MTAPQNTHVFELQVSPTVLSARADRGLKKPCRELKEIIDLVNLPGPDYRFDGLRWLKMLVSDSWELPDFDEVRRETDRLLLQSLDSLPGPLSKYLKSVFDAPEKVSTELPPYEAVLMRFTQIGQWRDTLRAIARREGNIKSKPEMLSLDLRVRLLVDFNAGTQREIKDQLLAALEAQKEQGNEGDFRYIRECLNCREIYFAGRLTYKGKEVLATCKASCRKAIHNRRSKNRKSDPPREWIESVKRVLKAFCKEKKLPAFYRTHENTSEVAIRGGLTVKQTERVLDFLEGKSTQKRTIKTRKR